MSSRVLVLWADDRSANLGVRALAAGAESLARMAMGPVTIDFQDFAPNAAGFNPGKRNVGRDIFSRHGVIDQWISQYDVVLDTGAGDSLTDIYGAKRLLMMMYTQRAAYRAGVPVIFLPQTIGPFGSPLLRQMARRNLSRASGIFARDSWSRSYAHKAMRLEAEPSTDVVFALPVGDVRRRPDTIIVNVSGLLWDENRHVDYLRYRRHLRQLSIEIRRSGLRVNLMAHVLENDSADNDVRVLEQAADLLEAQETVVPKDLPEARLRLGEAAAVVGSRMHACLNSLSMGTPSFAWAYSRKFAPLLRDLNWGHLYDLREPGSPVSPTMKFIEAAASDRLQSEVLVVRTDAGRKLDAVVNKLRLLLADR